MTSPTYPPNPGLQPLAPFIGEWRTEGTHPMLPGRTFHGRTTYEWFDSGAFVLVRTHIDEPEIPDGVAVFGTDDAHPGSGTMLYFDVRGVAREYRGTCADNVLTTSRSDAALSQRMQHVVAADGQSIVTKGEMSRDGGAWGPDLELHYTRVR
jgi:hypothetical protein